MKILNQKGLTLIEILAAVVILMVVIVGFLSFFSQATSHSRITEDKLTAINLAEKTLVKIKKEEEIEPLTHNGKSYTYECKFVENPLEDEQRKKKEKEEELKLHRIVVKIYKENKNTPLTELYSYLEKEENSFCER